MQSLTIIMPTYNEAGNICELIKESVRYARAAGVPQVEVLVVDDNSPDGTAELAAETRSPEFVLRVIRRMKDRGLTNSLRDGVAAASHDVVLWFDCDFSHPPEYIPQMVSMIDHGYDVVVNSRYVAGGSEERGGEGGRLQLFLSQAFNWSMRFLLVPAFGDYTSGFIMVRKAVLDAYPLRGDYGEYFIDLMYRVLRSDFKVCELPYASVPRHSGESKTGAGFADFARRGRKYIATALRLRFEGRNVAQKKTAPKKPAASPQTVSAAGSDNPQLVANDLP